jgi:hypothetical protein
LLGGLYLALAVGSPALSAQNIPLGSHVRVFPLATAHPSEGSLAALSPDSLSVRVGMSSTLTTIPMDSVLAIDVGQGVRASHGVVLKDAGIGAAIGIGVVLIAAKAVCSGGSDDFCGLEAFLTAVPIGVVGALLGAHVGRRGEHEQWERVFERARTTSLLVGPTAHHGFAIGLSIPFGSGVSAQ